MKSLSSAEREVLRKAKRIFVDFGRVKTEDLVACYDLCSDTFGNKDTDFAQNDEMRFVAKNIIEAVKQLPCRSREYICLKYGFDGGLKHTSCDIAILMGITERELVKIKSKAFELFRKKSKDIFVINVLAELELRNKALEAHIRLLEEKTKSVESSSIVVDKKLIKCFGLSTRAYNILRRNGVSTVEEFVNLSMEWVSQCRGVGPDTFKEIEEKQKEIRNILLENS